MSWLLAPSIFSLWTKSLPAEEVHFFPGIHPENTGLLSSFQQGKKTKQTLVRNHLVRKAAHGDSCYGTRLFPNPSPTANSRALSGTKPVDVGKHLRLKILIGLKDFFLLYLWNSQSVFSLLFTVVKQKERRSGKETNVTTSPKHFQLCSTLKKMFVCFLKKEKKKGHWWDDTNMMRPNKLREGVGGLTEGKYPIQHISTPYRQTPLKISVRQY